uniref:Secreted protein n=1 Tax=Arundo donax TaxID=35708 RepID=A0A0A8YQM7_ARUDO
MIFRLLILMPFCIMRVPAFKSARLPASSFSSSCSIWRRRESNIIMIASTDSFGSLDEDGQEVSTLLRLILIDLHLM